jgi:hypothetical protein
VRSIKAGREDGVCEPDAEEDEEDRALFAEMIGILYSNPSRAKRAGGGGSVREERISGRSGTDGGLRLALAAAYARRQGLSLRLSDRDI